MSFQSSCWNFPNLCVGWHLITYLAREGWVTSFEYTNRLLHSIWIMSSLLTIKLCKQWCNIKRSTWKFYKWTWQIAWTLTKISSRELLCLMSRRHDRWHDDITSLFDYLIVMTTLRQVVWLVASENISSCLPGEQNGQNISKTLGR